jgi:hypothetical protein
VYIYYGFAISEERKYVEEERERKYAAAFLTFLTYIWFSFLTEDSLFPLCHLSNKQYHAELKTSVFMVCKP